MDSVIAKGEHPTHKMHYREASMDRACRRCGADEHSDLITSPCTKCSHQNAIVVSAFETASVAVSELLFKRVRFMRMAAAVERCHMKPHALRYSIGHHTHDLVSLVLQCWMASHGGQLPRAELLVACHVHDHPEIVTGDVASPIKDLLGEKLKAVDAHAEGWLGLATELTPEEALYLAAADRFEFWLWAWEEASGRGNTDVLDWAEAYETRWRQDPLPWPFMDLMEQVLAHKGVPQLDRATLFEAGGLS